MGGALAASNKLVEAYSPESSFSHSAWISREEFRKLRAHPALPGSVARFAASLIEQYTGNILVNTLLGDRGRVVVGLFVLYLDVLPLPGTEKRGATLGAVRLLCQMTGLCSPGRAASVLAAMRFGGYVTSQADPEDHRRRILAPTPKLVAAYQMHWGLQFEAMTPVFPDSALVLAQLHNPVCRTAFLHALGTYYLAGFRVVDHAPVLAHIAESTGGLLLMSSVALGQLTGAVRAREASPVSVSALSRHFCVSRAHVRNVLAALVRAGLIEHRPGSDVVVVLPRLVDALIEFYGAMFILFHRCGADLVK